MPRSNHLSLVYRDKDAVRFVKHVNHNITQLDHPYFYDISLVYHEPWGYLHLSNWDLVEYVNIYVHISCATLYNNILY